MDSFGGFESVRSRDAPMGGCAAIGASVEWSDRDTECFEVQRSNLNQAIAHTRWNELNVD